jgi:hypothetical protein
MSESSRRIMLRDLPLAARVTLAAFLISVGLGYFAALVQLHAQQAKAGQVLPGEDEVIEAYHGKKGVSVLERLITADEHRPFTASGSMRPAFTTKSLGWKGTLKARASEIAKLNPEEKQRRLDEIEKGWKEQHKDARLPAEPDRVRRDAEMELRGERDGEAAAFVAWLRGGADKQSYEENDFTLPSALKTTPITEAYVTDAGNPDENKPRHIALRNLINDRCCKCHRENVTDPASGAPLDTYERLAAYVAEEGDTGMPLRKLAQSTHVHLLGFSMLYMLTGLIFACSSWPGILRVLIAPLALVAQVVDISFWWLARLDAPYGPEFASCIRFSGMVVAGALGLQIILSLFSLFGWFGRFVLLLLFLLAAVGAYYLNDLVIGPYLVQQAKLVAQ